MSKRKITMLVVTLVCSLLLTGIALANGGAPGVDWSVIGGGGGHVEVPPYTLDGTIGQVVAGVFREGTRDLCAGFWCGVAREHEIYLPVVLKGYS